MSDLAGSTIVLDASALLAFVHGEPGASVVGPMLHGAVMSSVNWSEVLQKAMARGVNVDGLRDDITGLGTHIMPFEVEDAEMAAALWSSTRSIGLSLGDRACVALGLRLKLPVLTADRAWEKIDAGVEVRTVR